MIKDEKTKKILFKATKSFSKLTIHTKKELIIKKM